MNWTGLNLSLEFCHFRSVASYITGLSKALTMHLAPWDTFIISHLIPELLKAFRKLQGKHFTPQISTSAKGERSDKLSGSVKGTQRGKTPGARFVPGRVHSMSGCQNASPYLPAKVRHADA